VPGNKVGLSGCGEEADCKRERNKEQQEIGFCGRLAKLTIVLPCPKESISRMTNEL